MPDIWIERLTKRFGGDVTAVDELDLHIGKGEFFSLLGPSGCGKTTLLRMLAGLEQPTSGTIRFGDADVTRKPPGDRDVAMVFQDYALYPHMTVNDNIAYPLKVRKVDKAERRDRAKQAADSLSLVQLLERRPGELSGGQQQRVAVARAIAYEPNLFLFDEPLSNLDARLRLEARTFLKRLQAELGVSAVYVTHDQSEALALSDRMGVMRDGKIQQIGTPEEVFLRPSQVFVASFIGSVPMNLLDSTVHNERLHLGAHSIDVPSAYAGKLESGTPIVLGMRPEHGQLVSPEQPNSLTGKVVVSELIGTEHLVTVEAKGLSVQVVTPERSPEGDHVGVAFDERHALLYDAESGRLIADSD